MVANPNVGPLFSIFGNPVEFRQTRTTVRVGWACLLFNFQRSSKGGEWGVVVVDEALEVVPNESKMRGYVSKIV